MRKAATTCEVVQLSEVPPRGAELSDDSPGNRPVSKQRDAEYDAFSGVDLELVAVIQAWAELPESVKTAVMKMVRGECRLLRCCRCLSLVVHRVQFAWPLCDVLE